MECVSALPEFPTFPSLQVFKSVYNKGCVADISLFTKCHCWVWRLIIRNCIYLDKVESWLPYSCLGWFTIFNFIYLHFHVSFKFIFSITEKEIMPLHILQEMCWIVLHLLLKHDQLKTGFPFMSLSVGSFPIILFIRNLAELLG